MLSLTKSLSRWLSKKSRSTDHGNQDVQAQQRQAGTAQQRPETSPHASRSWKARGRTSADAAPPEVATCLEPSSSTPAVPTRDEQNKAGEAFILADQHTGDALHSRPPPRQRDLREGDPEYPLHLPVTQVDPRDLDTPDRWVPRHPSLIRLTGEHPLNAGPPMAELLQSFITPTSLHYVRSHGQVPHIKWEDHQIVIDGMVSRPLRITMDHLMSLPQRTVLSTMACARLRRKELNVLRKTQGYAGGPQAIATGVWTGVLLRDLLALAGAGTWEQGARWVHVGGPKGEVSPGDTTYTSSLPYHQCVDPTADVLVAYLHNGRLLTPDHGYPVRLIVPGNIGGRSIKWLSHVDSRDTENHYHLHDNRYLPPHINTVEEAEAEGLLHDPTCACREQNINSAITHPVHGTEVPAEGEVTFRGYAIGGGGREVVRVELSTDGGDNWEEAVFDECAPACTRGPAGKHWAWVLWRWTVAREKIAKDGAEVRLRAVDAAFNPQPEKPTWNLIGMMNNCQYVMRVRSVGGRLLLLHPAPVDPSDVPGWMELDKEEREKEAGYDVLTRVDLEAEEAAGKAWDKLKEIDMEEVSRHTSEETGVWFVRDSKVYDATPFIHEHPGGKDIILKNAGHDASAVFDSIHSPDARQLVTRFLIGKIKGAQDPYTAVREAIAKGAPATGAPAGGVAGVREDVALSPLQARPFKLVSKESVSHDTRRFRFALPRPEQHLGLPVGQHIQLVAQVEGQQVVRPYTPVTLDSEHEPHFELVVKVYPPRDGIPGGKMSTYLDGLKEGDTIDVRGPSGQIQYLGRGRLRWRPQGGGARDERVSRINLVGGGTGITPLYQVAKAILSDPEDETEVRLIYGNRTEDDILLRDDLERFAQDRRFKVFFTLDRPSDSWQGGRGYISQDMLREQSFPPGPGCVTMVCGPPGMIEKGVKPALADLGFARTCIIDFDEGHR